MGEIKQDLSEQVKYTVQTGADDQVDQKEEDRRQSGQNKDHSGGYQNLAAVRPYDFRDFRTDLLNELKRVGRGHDALFL